MNSSLFNQELRKWFSINKKAQGLPIYAIGIIIIGIIALAVLLIFIFSASGESTEQIGNIFDLEENFSSEARETAEQYTVRESASLKISKNISQHSI